MKSLKIKTELELIPAITLGIGIDDSKGLIILLPFVCVTINRIKPKRVIQPVKSRHQGVNIKNTPKKLHDETAEKIRSAMANQVISKF